MRVLGVFAQVGTIKAKQEMGSDRQVQNTVLSNLKPDDFRHQKVPLLWQLSNSPRRLQLAPARAVKREFSHRWPFLALFPGEKELRVAKIKSV